MGVASGCVTMGVSGMLSGIVGSAPICDPAFSTEAVPYRRRLMPSCVVRLLSVLFFFGLLNIVSLFFYFPL